MTSSPWRAGTATGIGSLPGGDFAEALALVFGELPVPHLPELPSRGPHADLAGRGAALLHDLHVDLQPSGWRLVPRPSRDGRRARDLLARDLDALQAAAGDAPPALVKVQATGPWTLAALLELHRGDRVLADHGAVADLTASLAEGLALHVAEVSRRLSGCTVALQLDEPSLPAVLAAQVPTSSGFGRLRAPDPQTARDRLREVLAAAGTTTVVHCCAPHPPLSLMAEADAVSLDAALPFDADALGEAVEQGTGLLLGVVPTTGPLPTTKAVLETVARVRDRVGVTDLALTPACGLAGVTPQHARAVLTRIAEAARELEAPDG